jgi:hypothetical protein
LALFACQPIQPFYWISIDEIPTSNSNNPDIPLRPLIKLHEKLLLSLVFIWPLIGIFLLIKAEFCNASTCDKKLRQATIRDGQIIYWSSVAVVVATFFLQGVLFLGKKIAKQICKMKKSQFV